MIELETHFKVFPLNSAHSPCADTELSIKHFCLYLLNAFVVLAQFSVLWCILDFRKFYVEF